MSTFRLPALFALTALLLLAAACSNGDDDPPPTSTPQPSVTAGGGGQPISAGDAASSSDPLPVPDCGAEEQLHGTNINRTARECLWDGYTSGEGGQFLTTITTIEGDSVVRHIAVFSQDRVVVMIDNTEDQFSAPEDRVVVHYECTAMALTTDGQNDLAFEISGCLGDNGDDLDGGSLVI